MGARTDRSAAFLVASLTFLAFAPGGAARAAVRAPAHVTRRTYESAARRDLSPPLRELMSAHAASARAFPALRVPLRETGTAPASHPRMAVPSNLSGPMPAPSVSFDGIGQAQNASDEHYTPPDTNGDVGPNDYVEYVNASWAVYDKTGTLILGPSRGNTFWAGLGGVCETGNDGDPIVQYDQLADRWMVSQFGFNLDADFMPTGPFYQCIAISQTPDPTGSWYRYAYFFSDTLLNDYPKFGVWPDAYYMSANEYDENGFSFVGVAAMAFDRETMLVGGNANALLFEVGGVQEGDFLPADLDGVTLPPAAAPNPYTALDGTNGLDVWDFHVDWRKPSSSYFGQNSILDIPEFAYPCPGVYYCAHQPDPGGGPYPLDSLGDRLMYRAAYRNLGGHEALLVNHTVDTGGGVLGVAWYEVRAATTTPELYQSGVYSPDDTDRWMGSIAMDKDGNVGLEYSASSDSIFPSIAYTGRLAGDPSGSMTFDEGTIVAGGGVQTSPGARWGDYSSLSVDPDGCTFWAANEYYAATSAHDWSTRVAAFAFPGCTPLPAGGTLTGHVTSSQTAGPVAGVAVRVGDHVAITDASGAYSIPNLTEGTVSARATKPGLAVASASSIAITSGGTTTQDFTMSPATPPTAPTILAPAGGTLSTVRSVEVEGTSQPNVDVAIYEADPSQPDLQHPIDTIAANSSGDWSDGIPLADGSHALYAIAVDDAGNNSVTSNTVLFRVAASPPSAPTIVSPRDGAALRSHSVSLTGTAEPGTTVRAEVFSSSLGFLTSNPVAVGSAGAWRIPLSLADGLAEIDVVATDQYAHQSDPSDPIVVTIDTVAPSHLRLTGITGHFLSAASLPLRWSARDDGTGIASYDVRYRRARFDGDLGSAGYLRQRTTTTSGRAVLRNGYTYCYAVRARDHAGNVSAFSPSRCTALPLDDASSSIARSSGWAEHTGASYFDGSAAATTRRGATLTLAGVRAHNLALLVATCPGCGSVSVSLNGVELARVSLDGPVAYRHLLAVASLPRLTAGILRVRVVSPSGRRVTIDGIGVNRA